MYLLICTNKTVQWIFRAFDAICIKLNFPFRKVDYGFRFLSFLIKNSMRRHFFVSVHLLVDFKSIWSYDTIDDVRWSTKNILLDYERIFFSCFFHWKSFAGWILFDYYYYYYIKWKWEGSIKAMATTDSEILDYLQF